MNKPHRTSGETVPLDREALESFWLPFTPNRQFKADPRLFVAAEGMHYVTSDGRRILDAMAGLWCVNAGHGQRAIVDAIKAQAERLDFVSSFQMSHPAASNWRDALRRSRQRASTIFSSPIPVPKPSIRH